MQCPFFPQSKISHYTILEQIGHGSTSCVYKAQENYTNQIVAIKIMSKNNNNEYIAQCRKREFNISFNVQHPLIVPVYEQIDSESYHYYVMEYVNGKTLLDYVNEHSALNDSQIRKFFQQLISIIHYLHNEMHVVHRDLKAENILVDSDDNIRLIDFGFSTFIENDQFLKTICGSPAYLAPEIINRQPYSKAVDIWSAGIILYAISHQTLPFYNNNTVIMLSNIVNNEPTFSPFLSPLLIDLLSQMLVKNPLERIPLENIEKHGWFKAQIPYNYSNLFLKLLCPYQPLDNEVISKIEKCLHRTAKFISNCLIASVKNEFHDMDEESTLIVTIYKILRREIINKILKQSRIQKYSDLQVTSKISVLPPLIQGLSPKIKFARKNSMQLKKTTISLGATLVLNNASTHKNNDSRKLSQDKRISTVPPKLF